jgi:hypothetical protein
LIIPPEFVPAYRNTCSGDIDMGAASLDEEKFNLEIRKFLKVVGITSQREIEKAVREAVAAGTLRPGDQVAARVTLELPGLGVRREIAEDLDLA